MYIVTTLCARSFQRGVIETSAGTLFIEPVGATPEDPHTLPHQHLVYTHPPELRGNGAWTYGKWLHDLAECGEICVYCDYMQLVTLLNGVGVKCMRSCEYI